MGYQDNLVVIPANAFELAVELHFHEPRGWSGKMNVFKTVIFCLMMSFVTNNVLAAGFDTIPSGFRLKSASLSDGSNQLKTQATFNSLAVSDCLLTDLQMQAIGLYDYVQEFIYTGNVKGTVRFKKRVCSGEGRTPFIDMSIFTSSNSLSVRLISPSGIVIPLKSEASSLKANQYRITKDFSKIGSTVGDYGSRTDVRAEAGEWTLELTSAGGAKIDMLDWGASSNFWLLFPN